VDFPIPANDDASKSIVAIMDVIVQSIAEGLQERKVDKDKAAAEKSAAEEAAAKETAAAPEAAADSGEQAEA
jgi:small subunit ribosomal protein S2